MFRAHYYSTGDWKVGVSNSSLHSSSLDESNSRYPDLFALSAPRSGAALFDFFIEPEYTEGVSNFTSLFKNEVARNDSTIERYAKVTGNLAFYSSDLYLSRMILDRPVDNLDVVGFFHTCGEGVLRLTKMHSGFLSLSDEIEDDRDDERETFYLRLFADEESVRTGPHNFKNVNFMAESIDISDTIGVEVSINDFRVVSSSYLGIVVYLVFAFIAVVSERALYHYQAQKAQPGVDGVQELSWGFLLTSVIYNWFSALGYTIAPFLLFAMEIEGSLMLSFMSIGLGIFGEKSFPFWFLPSRPPPVTRENWQREIDQWKKEIKPRAFFYVSILVAGPFLVFTIGFWRTVLLGMFSFWVPQIVRNSARDNAYPMSAPFLILMPAARLLTPTIALWLPLAPPNHDYASIFFLYTWVGIQILVLSAQQSQFFGPQFLLPRMFRIEKFDYRSIPKSEHVPTEEEELECSICMSPILIRSTNRSAAVEARKRTKDQLVETAQAVATDILRKWNGVKSLVMFRRWNRNDDGGGNDDLEAARRTSGDSSGDGGKTQDDDDDDDDEEEESGLRPDADEYMRTPCGHFFHERCLKSWINVKSECPICRAPLPHI